MNQTLQRIPFLRLFVPFIAGIVCQYYYDHARLYCLVAAAATIVLLSSLVLKENYGRRWMFGIFAGLFCFAAGCLSMRMALKDTEWQDTPERKQYRAVLQEYPVEKQKTVLCRLRLSDSGKRVVVYLAKDSLSRALIPGRILRFYATLRPFEKTENTVGFDYNLYLKKQGYAAGGYVAAKDWTTTGRKFGLKYKALEYQRGLASTLRNAGLSKEAYNFGTTMLLGYRELMDAELNQSFAVAGISHVISISGLHTQIIFMMFVFLFSFLGHSRKKKIIQQTIILLSMWVFTYISGLSPPVIRASAMLTFYGLADMFGKQALNLNVVFASAFLMLLYKPFYLFDISFQLTYLAVLSIVLVFPALESLHTTRNPFVRYLWAAFCISVSAQLATAPLCVYYFQQFPTYFWLANVVIAPLVGPALIGMILILALHPLLSLPLWCYQPVSWALEGIIATAQAIEKLPGALITGIQSDIWQTIFWYGIILSLLAFFRFKTAKYIYLLQSFVLLQVIHYL